MSNALSKRSVSELTREEMDVYYSGNKKVLSALEKLDKLRAKSKKTTDSTAKRAVTDDISKLKKEIRDLQLDHFAKLKKKRIVAVGKPFSGIMPAHPGEKSFSCAQDRPASLPVDQADDLIGSGLAKEVKA